MTYVDTAILDATEWLCRRFQRLTGRTNVWLALQLTNLSIVVYFVWAGLYLWTGGDTVSRVAVGAIGAVVLYALTQTLFRDSVETHELNAYRRVANGFRNPRRVRDALLRIMFVTLSLMLCGPILLVSSTIRFQILLLSYWLILLTTIVLYLLACDPLPPCAGRVQEWLRGIVPSGAAAQARPAVTPQPTSEASPAERGPVRS
jgi:hypothetical protein